MRTNLKDADAIEALEMTSSTSHSGNLCSMNKAEKLTVIIICLVTLLVGALFSIIAPFFPTEASKKGVKSTLVGFIFAAYELTIVLTSPILGTLISRIGAKLMFTAGIFVCGVAVILLGFLDAIEDTAIFVVTCFVVRCIEALGGAALFTASFAIFANTFPDNISMMMGLQQSMKASGLMIGPPIGGALFELGGFILPFAILGSTLILAGVASIFLLPSQHVERLACERSSCSLLRIPAVLIVGLCLVAGNTCVGYRNVSLAVFLFEKFDLKSVHVGLVFFVGPIMNVVMSPLFGYIGDREPRLDKYFIAAGVMIVGISFFVIGPAPFFHIQSALWLVILSMFMLGLGMGMLAPSAKVIASETIRKAGYSNCLATYGLVAGLVGTFLSCGAFAGPLLGGYLEDRVGFEITSVAIGSGALVASLIMLAYALISSLLGPRSEYRDLEEDSQMGNVEPRQVRSDISDCIPQNGTSPIID